MRNAGYILYILVFMLIIVFPLAGMAIPGSESSEAMYAAEKQDLAPMPDFMTPDGINESYLGDLGAWFEDHMAFRNAMISGNSLIREYTLGSSADDKVIMGSDRWLYYHGTEDDFLGRDLMSNRELFDAAHNLRLMQQYVEDNECRFLFAIAANKNSIYPEHMPYSYMYSADSNAASLVTFLNAAGVNFVNLRDSLANGQPDLYFQRDTHWNGKGALIGYNAILDGLGIGHQSYSSTRWISRVEHTGDLDEMLYPGMAAPETDYYIDVPAEYSYDQIPETMRDPFIHTTNDDGSGTLYMFRDSFGDALIPLLSRHFAEATYTTYRPWNFPEAVRQRGTDVVVEIVERNLVDLLNRPAIIPAPEIGSITVTAGSAAAENVRAQRDGPYVCISGRIAPELISQTSQIAVRADTGGEMHTYEPFYTSNKERLGNSFYLYLPVDGTAGSMYVEICVGPSHETMQVVLADTIPIEQGEN